MMAFLGTSSLVQAICAATVAAMFLGSVVWWFRRPLPSEPVVYQITWPEIVITHAPAPEIVITHVPPAVVVDSSVTITATAHDPVRKAIGS